MFTSLSEIQFRWQFKVLEKKLLFFEIIMVFFYLEKKRLDRVAMARMLRSRVEKESEPC